MITIKFFLKIYFWCKFKNIRFSHFQQYDVCFAFQYIYIIFTGQFGTVHLGNKLKWFTNMFVYWKKESILSSPISRYRKLSEAIKTHFRLI